MKTLPLITALILTTVASALHAQTSSILIKPGDQVKGISTNPATIGSMNWVTMNDIGGISFQAWATEGGNRTNVVTNPVTRTNFSVSIQYTNVLTSNPIIRFLGTVTNVVYTTNNWNVNGTTNAYVNKFAQIRYATNQFGTTNSNNLSSFTNTFHTPQGGRNVTNRTIVTTNIISTNIAPALAYSGIWASDTNGQINLLIRAGQPSGISNSVINSFYNPIVNNNGAVAVVGYARVTNSVSTNGIVTNATSTITSIYLAQQGSTNPIRVASVGYPAPGTSENFTSLGIYAGFGLPDVGGVVFYGSAGTNQGIWVQNPDTSVRLVALTGRSITVGSTNKVIRNFNFSTFNGNFSQDTGVITCQVFFTDGTSAVIRVNR